MYFKSSKGPLSSNMEPFLAACLLPAMKMHAGLSLAGTASTRLLRATVQLEEIFHRWNSTLLPIPVTAASETEARLDASRAVGCFFSGGLNSFYTVLKHLDEIDYLITVRGFDIRLADQDVQARITSSLRAAAAELGKPLIEVETNLQDVLEDFVDWRMLFGPALASVALLLAPVLRKVYVAASDTYRHGLHPWDPHPLLDPLWSTDTVEIVHDGCEASRIDKAARLATSDTALKYLRVCWGYREAYDKGLYNCGHCEKCLRTQVNLYLAGALDRCATLDHTLDYAALSRLPIQKASLRIYVEENLEAAERLHTNPALVQALRESLNRPILGAHRLDRIVELNAAVRRLQQENSELKQTVQALYQSRSWRFTWPLRRLADASRRFLPRTTR